MTRVRTRPDRPRRLVVLRHGETTHNATGVWQGQLDSPLSARGEAQAAAVGPALAAFQPVRVVTSDLQRARLTGGRVAEAAGVPLSEDARLREVHAGAWQGLTSEEIGARWPAEIAALRRGEDIQRPGGESMAQVLARVAEAAHEVLEATTAGECVVLSTHGAAGRMLVAALLGLDVDTAWRVLGPLGNAHWADLSQGALGWRLDAWNASAPVPAGSRSASG